MTQTNPNQPQTYIQEHKEFSILKNYMEENNLIPLKYQSHFRNAFDFLKFTLYDRYNTTSINSFVTKSFEINEAKHFSVSMNKVYPQLNWSYSTAKCMLCYLKKILKETAINPAFIKKISIINDKPKQTKNNLLTKRINMLDDEDKSKKELLNWIYIIKTNTNNKSEQSLKGIMYFLINEVVPSLQINLYNFIPEEIEITNEKIKELVNDV